MKVNLYVFFFFVDGVCKKFKDLDTHVEIFANNGKIVIIAALNSTFERKSFDVVSKVIPKCEELIKLHAKCNYCYEDADFTKRIGKNKEKILIGSFGMYVAVCRKCYFLK